jgi:hypothetical protein
MTTTTSAKILAHSISPNGAPICTMEVTFPRIILAELNTHTLFSRNSASSRAIPVAKMLARVREDPFNPESWPSNGKGMKEGDPLGYGQAREAYDRWLLARNAAAGHAREMEIIGVQKGYTNRLLEPFLWHTAIVTSTEWSNFFNLRANPEAHGEMQQLAQAMKEAYEASTPRKLDYGEWHLPLIFSEDYEPAMRLAGKLTETGGSNELTKILIKVSVGRCARVSYLTHDGKRDLQADIDLYDRLLGNGHMSPFQHVARPIEDADYLNEDLALLIHHKYLRSDAEFPPNRETWCGNYRGWVQQRKLIAGEFDMLAPKVSQ